MREIENSNSSMILSMLEEYIDEFNVLIELCHWKKDTADTIWHFKKGLMKSLLAAVLKEMHPQLITLAKWQEVA
jgi:hypothetical protein